MNLVAGATSAWETFPAALQAVTAEDLHARRHHLPDREQPHHRLVRTDLGGRLMAAVPTPAHALRAQQVTLSNGVTVLHNRAAANPSVVVRAMVRAGASREAPPGATGIASFTGGMLRQGTEHISKEALAEELDGLGAGLSVDVGYAIGVDLDQVPELGYDPRHGDSGRAASLPHLPGRRARAPARPAPDRAEGAGRQYPRRRGAHLAPGRLPGRPSLRRADRSAPRPPSRASSATSSSPSSAPGTGHRRRR